MELSFIITIVVILSAIVLFATEAVRVDLVAIGVMVVWIVFGILEPEESFRGFANSATLTVTAMFILSSAMIRAGVIKLLAPLVTRLFSKTYGGAILGMSSGVGLLSAFINNTPVVATFIPIVSKAAKKLSLHPSKFLIPLSYGAILGGTCTLIGTSTNLLVAGIAKDKGFEGIGLFTMAPMGLVFLVVGLLYLMFAGKYLLPKESQVKPLQDDSQITKFLTEVKIKELPDEKTGISIEGLFKRKDLTFEVQELRREDSSIKNPKMNTRLQAGDVMLIKGELDKVKKVVADQHLSIVKSITDKYFPEEETKVVEVIIMPGTHLVDKKLKNINFLKNYHSHLLAIRHRGKRQFKDMENIRLKVGDILLLQTSQKGHELLQKAESNPNAPFLSVRESDLDIPDKRKLYISSIVLALVIVAATFNILPIVASAWAGVFLLGIFRIISMTDAYRSIDWQVIFLLAGSLSFGTAMEKSGLNDWLVTNFLAFTENQTAPFIMIAGIYLITMLFTEIISNNAAAALMAPLAMSIAEALSFSPLPFLIAVMMAGSASFMTPIGYQTNTMVYSAGNYDFKDFFKIGAPLGIIFWIIASLLIPIFYSF
ncbi:SLC13 family permease [Marivirga harenae]|uniref:SLC13 family permease n=1 Tax=Marivirga harenae TaxID=2010992 RepID=UPI0026E02CFE|nr:SLC13 family permease [Marivirga harenae]WKV12226.1 SLC13 family permease [Marivirga harenae]|tara:strand:- start:344012 stop:345805 length:1794 start_codon:yes stop_codon:yes gene_type:complete